MITEYKSIPYKVLQYFINLEFTTHSIRKINIDMFNKYRDDRYTDLLVDSIDIDTTISKRLYTDNGGVSYRDKYLPNNRIKYIRSLMKHPNFTTDMLLDMSLLYSNHLKSITAFINNYSYLIEYYIIELNKVCCTEYKPYIEQRVTNYLYSQYLGIVSEQSLINISIYKYLKGISKTYLIKTSNRLDMAGIDFIDNKGRLYQLKTVSNYLVQDYLIGKYSTFTDNNITKNINLLVYKPNYIECKLDKIGNKYFKSYRVDKF